MLKYVIGFLSHASIPYFLQLEQMYDFQLNGFCNVGLL